MYPKEDSRRCGCKVSWLTYVKFEDAEKASKIAIKEAKVRREKGYDFGYCCPGFINILKDGKFEVCIP